MKTHQRRKCHSCQELFKPDSRNAHHQKYCDKPGCRKASKQASNQKWLEKPENKNYHSGPLAVARVQEAQKLHPEYRARQKAKRGAALQDVLVAQAIDLKEENPTFTSLEKPPESTPKPALQDILVAQPHVLIGLIAHFFGVALQDDIANISHTLQKFGEDITNGRYPDEPAKAGHLPGTDTNRAGKIQLGRSTPGAGASP